MNLYSPRYLLCCLTLLVGGFALTGCFGLKKVVDPARYFVLAAQTNVPASTNEKVRNLGVGVGPVTLASYLGNNQLAIRRADHEIVYMDHLLWADRLDTSIPRILALNLSRLLGTDRVQVANWDRQEVSIEVYVTLHRFDWDENGQANLEAQWQLRKPGAPMMIAGGTTQLQGDGPSLQEDSEGAVSTLNSLLFHINPPCPANPGGSGSVQSMGTEQHPQPAQLIQPRERIQVD